MYVGTVPHSCEVHRVATMPSYQLSELKVQDWTNQFVHRFRRPNSTMQPWPAQARGLHALQHHLGLFAPMGVGDGKTLITYAAPLVLPHVRRYALLVPGALVEKTWRDFDALRRHWAWPSHCHIEIISYSLLSQAKRSTLLVDYNPDLVIADEAEALKSHTSAVAKRTVNFLLDRRPIFAALSATMIHRSILDYHHLLLLALGEDHAPLPNTYREASKWAQALDEDPPVRRSLGALRSVFGPTLPEARKGFRRRLSTSRGVVYTDRAGLPCGVRIRTLDTPKLNRAARYELDRVTQELAHDDEHLPSDIARWAQTLLWGFYQTLGPPDPPPRWIEARRHWARFVRATISQGLPNLDTELQVRRACEAGTLSHYGIWDEWLAVKDTYDVEAHQRVVWLDDGPAKGVESKTKRGLIWTHYQALGKKLAGDCYFQNRGLDSHGRYIEDVDDPVAVLSIRGNRSGRNLQHQWDHNAVLNPMSSGHAWEQLLGRTVRNGQRSDVVTVDVYLGHPLIERKWEKALANAQFLGDIDESKILTLADKI